MCLKSLIYTERIIHRTSTQTGCKVKQLSGHIINPVYHTDGSNWSIARVYLVLFEKRIKNIQEQNRSPFAYHIEAFTKCIYMQKFLKWCKRMGLVHTLVMSIKPICRYSSTWCRRGKSWSRHQNCKRIGWVHKVISLNLC